MQKCNIIGDIHGSYDALMDLVKIMPDAPFISVGDMIDRGPRSLDVLRFFMKDGNRAVLGNHEQLMLDVYYGRRIFGRGVWLDYRNGGYQTLKSFSPLKMEAWEYISLNEKGHDSITIEMVMNYIGRNKKKLFPEDVMQWVDSLPVYIEEEGLFLSHAPRNPHAKFEYLKNSKREPMKLSGAPQNLLWSMTAPGYIEGVTQIHGHIITPEPIYYRDDEKGIYAIGIDTFRGYGSRLTGLHWPSLEVFQVEVRSTDTTQNICENAVAKPPQNPV